MKNVLLRVGIVALALAILATVILTFLSYTGILFAASERYSVVVVLGAHQHGRTIDFDGNVTLQQSISRAVESFGYIAVVVADGEPRDQITVYDFTGERPSALERLRRWRSIDDQLEQNKTIVLNSMREKRASVAEVDMLLALDTAARQIAQRPESDVREIVVIGSGLSTTGFLNLAIEDSEGYSRWLHNNPEEIVAALVEGNNIPDFNGVPVIWSQMGQVGGEQPIFGGTLLANLEQIWRGIIVSGNGDSLRIAVSNPAPGYYGDDFPYVSIVKIRSQDPSLDFPDTQPNELSEAVDNDSG